MGMRMEMLFVLAGGLLGCGDQEDDPVDAAAALQSWAPVGTLSGFAGQSAPEGWLLCDGAELPRTQYRQLFAVIGEAYGRGDGSTTFRIPDLRGRTAIGAGIGEGLTERRLSERIGEESHILTVEEMPAHTHQERPGIGTNWYRVFDRSGGSWPSEALGNAPESMTGAAGGGCAHGNMQPSLVVSYIIKH